MNSRMSNISLKRSVGDDSIELLDFDRAKNRIHDFNQLYGQGLKVESKLAKTNALDFNQLYGFAMRNLPSRTENLKGNIQLKTTNLRKVICLFRDNCRQRRPFKYKVDCTKPFQIFNQTKFLFCFLLN